MSLILKEFAYSQFCSFCGSERLQDKLERHTVPFAKLGVAFQCHITESFCINCKTRGIEQDDRVLANLIISYALIRNKKCYGDAFCFVRQCIGWSATYMANRLGTHVNAILAVERRKSYKLSKVWEDRLEDAIVKQINTFLRAYSQSWPEFHS